jgi:hypothetical protein
MALLLSYNFQAEVHLTREDVRQDLPDPVFSFYLYKVIGNRV